MNVEPGHVYMFVYTANDPVSVALAMSIARNHMEVLASSTSYDYSSGIYVTGSRFRGALAGQPYRSWDVAVLEATSRGVPGVTASSNLDIDASELEGGEVYSSLRALFTSTAGAVSRASRTATAVTDTLSGGGSASGSGSWVPFAILATLAVVAVGALLYFFRTPLLDVAKKAAAGGAPVPT